MNCPVKPGIIDTVCRAMVHVRGDFVGDDDPAKAVATVMIGGFRRRSGRRCPDLMPAPVRAEGIGRRSEEKQSRKGSCCDFLCSREKAMESRMRDGSIRGCSMVAARSFRSHAPRPEARRICEDCSRRWLVTKFAITM